LENTEGKVTKGRPRHRWKDNINIGIKGKWYMFYGLALFGQG
jgi:hypothetical protein